MTVSDCRCAQCSKSIARGHEFAMNGMVFHLKCAPKWTREVRQYKFEKLEQRLDGSTCDLLR